MSDPNHLLRAARLERGISLRKLAKALNVSPSTVYRWEQGTQEPYPFHKGRLGDYFGKGPQELGFDVPPGLQTSSEQEHAEGSSFRFRSSLPECIAETDLVGRERDLAALRQRVLAGQVVLAGLPGIGKTTLALELALDSQIRSHFLDGVLWASLGQSSNLDDIVRTWGRLVLGFSSQKMARLSREQLIDALREAMGAQRICLILDDVWATVDAQILLQVAGPDCGYIVTTRSPMIGAELVGSHFYMLSELDGEAGLQLLALLAPRAVEQNPAKARALVEAVGGLPLALTLMGNYLASETWSGHVRHVQVALQYLERAEARLHLLVPATPRAGYPQRPAQPPISLQSVIELSDRTLSEEAREALYALAIFSPKPAHFSEEAACFVAGVEPEVLDELVNIGVVELAGGRYLLHQTISDYGKAHLAQADQVYARLIEYTLAYLRSHGHEHKELVLESSMICVALEAAHAFGKQHELIRLVLLFAPCMLAQGWLSLAELHLKRAVLAAQDIEDTANLALILLYLGRVQQKLGAHQEALASWQRALPLAREKHNQETVCLLLADLCWLLFLHGSFGEIIPYLAEGLPLGLEIGHAESLCCFLRIKGLIDFNLGDYISGEQALLQGLPLAIAQENDAEIPIYYLALAARPSRRGDYAQAEEYFQKGLEAAARAEDKMTKCLLLTYRVSMYTVYRPAPDLRDDLKRALELVPDDLGYSSLVFKWWSLLELVLRNLDRAEELAQQGLSLADRLQAKNMQGELKVCLAQVALARGKTTQAEAYLDEAFPFLRSNSNAEEQGRALMVRGDLALEQNQIETASAAFQEILDTAPKEHIELQAIAHFGLARVSAARGQKQEARAQAGESLLLFRRCGHRRTQEVHDWFLKRVRNPLQKMFDSDTSPT